MQEKNIHYRERFNACLNTWQSQVASYWQRTSYFALFETAAITATWKVIESGHWVTSIFACAAGLFLTRVWYLSNSRMWEYVTYWWTRAAAIEKSWELAADSQLVEGYEQRRIPKNIVGDYSDWVQRIPRLFAGIWIYLGLLSIALTWSYFKSCTCLDITGYFKSH
jgi:hypothetical protein